VPILAATRPGWITRLDELHLLTPLRIALILLVAFFATVIVTRLISRIVGRVAGLGPIGSSERSTPRSRSLSGARQSAVLAAIWFIAAIAIISELGVNVGGVVLTATVVGGALAFGAQSLVRDLIAGMFVLAEDQYGVGDIIDVGPLIGGSVPISGTVERISLRATRLRDSEGRVWHVPNGAIVRVANLSLRSMAVLEMHVDRSMTVTDLEAVATQLGDELMSHTIAGPLCNGAPGYDGVVDLRDDRLVGRMHVQTLPGRHDEVRRIWRELSIAAYQDGRLPMPPPPIGFPPTSVD
jgi:moderate conductance mechanosensitive channel